MSHEYGMFCKQHVGAVCKTCTEDMERLSFVYRNRIIVYIITAYCCIAMFICLHHLLYLLTAPDIYQEDYHTSKLQCVCPQCALYMGTQLFTE